MKLLEVLEGLRPLPPTPADSRIFGFFDFSKNVDFLDFPVGFGVWEGLQSMGNGCGLQMDGFSAHFEPSGSISIDFHDLGDFAVVSEGLTLFTEGPRTLGKCSKGPGTLSKGPGTSEKLLWWSDAASGRFQAPLRVS